MAFFPRNPLSDPNAEAVANALQPVLVSLISLSLEAKQAHWTVYGTQFLSVHEKLDDVVKSARDGSDVLAERMAQLGHAPDGRISTVQATSPVQPYPDGDFHNVPETLTLMCDRVHTVSQTIRTAIEAVGEIDPPTEDYLNAIAQEVEEHLWMLQAMEKSNG